MNVSGGFFEHIVHLGGHQPKSQDIELNQCQWLHFFFFSVTGKVDCTRHMIQAKTVFFPRARYTYVCIFSSLVLTTAKQGVGEGAGAINNLGSCLNTCMP